MVFELEIITIAIGAIYGFLKPGKEDRTALLKRGALIGIILALILIGLGILMSALMGGGLVMLLGSGVVGVFIFIEILILAVLFIIGTFIGDWLEEKTKAV